MGSDMKTKVVQAGSETVKLQVWDTAGQERFRSLIPAYLHEAQGVVAVYDITSTCAANVDAESFQGLASWMDFVDENGSEEIKVAVVGNKVDLAGKRAVPSGNGLTFAEENDAVFMEVSAKSGENVELLFHNIAMAIIEAKSPTANKNPSMQLADHKLVRPEITGLDPNSCC
eukprot:TRINITY_DN1100_c0_g3_i3.p2 TRINITY_DN1100_c0_g3~~TRINITY_DN1100_c0_g3_i3.p2  ORF type:complete len:172 (+),score=42.24 TRINITY_DN1100_c0_g3_i3:252-767(+)